MRRVSLGARAVALVLAASGLAVAVVARGADGPSPQDFMQSPGPTIPGAPAFGANGPNFGSRSFGRDDGAPFADDPQGDSDDPGSQAPAAGRPANPSVAQGELDPDVARQRLLDALFQRLKKSSDNDEAEGVAGAIKRVWFDSGSDTADLLMGRALVAEHAQNYAVGRELLGKIVQIEPNWAEAWNELAVVRILSDDSDGAMEDLAHTLALEPRHFDALTGLGALLLRSGDKKGALKVFRRVLELYPRLGAVQSIVDRLTIQVEGRDL
jgi:tetratricopeptide (TPR) repeat protein